MTSRQGDTSYPISIPSKQYHGEPFNSVRQDDQTNPEVFHLNLASAYLESLRVMHYTREFVFSHGRQIIYRDRVAFDELLQLVGLFHV